jgi:hypothetical protein
MSDQPNRGAPQWGTAPSAKIRNAIQRSVTALLDELAPERVLKRTQLPEGAIEQHRTPTGCVLQAAECAVSVSWFADASATSPHGELNVLVWRGRVTRRGAAQVPKNATLLTQLVLRPIEPLTDECLWQSTDGARYDTASLAANCLALLEAQIASSK